MALSHFSQIYYHLLAFSSLPKSEQSPPRWRPLHKPVGRNLSLACSRDLPREKAKASRCTKSDEELYNELHEFVSMIGLPENRVPTLKELFEHGRKDLAKIVRRRGYKATTELLLSSNAKNSVKIFNENHERRDSCEDKNSGQEETAPIETAQDISSNYSPEVGEDTVNSSGEILANSNGIVHKSSESSPSILHFKAAKFIQTGELDDLEDTNTIYDGFGSLAAIVVSQQVAPSTEERGVYSSQEDTNLDEESASEAFVKDNQIEINRLKALLHQKEMELSQLKQQKEEEKLELLNLQAKSKAEISKIQQNIAQKDAELRVAEEELNGLKEIQIDYWANGEVVEVAGSFNGWQHWIKMDLDPSSQSTNPSVSRQPLLWTAILWLYPGVYEIKFIVDGNWSIDYRRETLTSGNITNNVLRVDG